MSTSAVVFADVNDFTVTDFTADYYLTRDDPQGQLHIVEKIAVNFTDQNHGILRALPKTYKHLPLNIHINRISSDSGAPSSYTTSSDSNGNEIIKIGDPNRTVTGAQEYTIDYTMQNAVTFYADHDELYWNTSGLDWMQPFDGITAIVHLPAGLHLSHQTECYAGPEGSHDQPCTVVQQGDAIMVRTTSRLWPRETMSFVLGFEKGYFTAPSFWDYALGYLGQVLQFVIPFLLVGGAGFVWWWKRGRDAKGTGIIVPQYDAPDGLTPLEVGALVDFKVDNRDLTATIINLAICKYLRIVEVDASKLLVLKQKRYRLELLNKDWTKLNPYEWELMGGLFGVMGENPAIELAAMATKLQTEAKSIKSLVEKSLVDRGYFMADPTKYMAITAGTVAVVALALLLRAPMWGQGLILWGILAGGVVLGIFYHFLPARTAMGAAAREHIMGLKMYLEVAEKDRIRMLQSPDAPYAERSAEPEHTVELFEKLLPYAIVLKVEEQWAKKFADLYKTPPDWYAGNYRAFTAGYLVGSLSSGFNQAMVASFNPPRNSGISGFMGGGFAGGGGGGGGGGGW